VIYLNLMVNRAIENLVIFGSVPADCTTSIDAGRAKLKPVILECLKVAGIRGGQIMIITSSNRKSINNFRVF
jgi:hypothetical protein